MAGDRTLTVKILGDSSGASKAFAKLEHDGDGLSAKLGAVGKAVGAVMVGAGVAATAFGVKAVLSASDLAETMSKVGVVFGEQQAIVTGFANKMAKDFGTPKREILDAASAIGLIGKASGLSQGDAAKMSTQLAKLAADASSFYNVPLDEALQAIQSGLVGEAEPMRRFGVLLNAQAVDAEAARLGLQKVNGAYTEGAKAQARASLIMRGMTDASGDLERTQGSLANRLKELRGRAENFAADVGTKLLPVVLDAFDVFEKWGGQLAQFVAPVLAEIRGGLTAMFAAFKAGDGDVTSSGFAGAMEQVGNTARTVVEWFKANWPEIRKTIADVFEWVQANVVPVVVAVAKLIVEAFAGIVRWVVENWPQISEAIRHVVNVVVDIFNALAAFMRPLWDNIRGIIEGTIRVIAGIITTVLAVINGDWGRAWDGIKGTVAGAWQVIKNTIGGALDVIRTLLSPVGNWLHTWIVQPFEDVVGFIAGLPKRIGAVAVGMFDGIKDAFRSAINWIIRAWNRLEFKIPGFDPPGPGPSFAGFTLGVPNIPTLHSGGIFRAPTPGGEGLALLRDQERVLPAGQAAAGQTVIHVTFPNYVGDKNDLGRWVLEWLRQYAAAGGALPV